jgi:hypothetical protein
VGSRSRPRPGPSSQRVWSIAGAVDGDAVAVAGEGSPMDMRPGLERCVAAEAVVRDPYAEVRAILADAGLTVDLQDGVWRVEGAFTNPYRAAARAVTELVRIDGSAAVVARNPRCAVLIAVADKTMVLVDSRMPVWRLYSLSGTRTPLSMTINCPGPPPNARTLPLRSNPPEASDVGARLSLDLASLAVEMRSLIACI